MKRLAFFFLFSCLSVFGAIGAAVHYRQPLQLQSPERQQTVRLTVYSPPKPPKAVEKAQPEPKPKPRPEPTPKPEPKPATKPAEMPKPVPEPAAAPPKAPEPAKAETQAPAEPKAHETVPTPPERPSAAARQPVDAYYARLYQRISRYKYYPAQAKRFGIEGVVSIAFTLDSEGGIVRAELLRKSGNRFLDRAALEIFRRIGRFDKPPETVTKRHFEIAIDYYLK